MCDCVNVWLRNFEIWNNTRIFAPEIEIAIWHYRLYWTIATRNMNNEILESSNEIKNAVSLIKDAILHSQQRALAAINQEQLALYYAIGRFISMNTRKKNWGTGFIEAISTQLRKELPGLRGFSAPSMRKMRTFYEEWRSLSDNSFVETNKIDSRQEKSFDATNKLPVVNFTIDSEFPIAAFMSIGFSHHYTIVSKVKDVEQRKFYIQLASDTKVSVDELEKLIDDDIYNLQTHDSRPVTGLSSHFHVQRRIPSWLY